MIIRTGDTLITATSFPGVDHQEIYMGGGKCMSASKRFGRVTETPCPIGDPTLRLLPAPNNSITRNAITARMASLENYAYDVWDFNCQDAGNYARHGVAFSPLRDAVKGLLAFGAGLALVAALSD